MTRPRENPGRDAGTWSGTRLSGRANAAGIPTQSGISGDAPWRAMAFGHYALVGASLGATSQAATSAKKATKAMMIME